MFFNNENKTETGKEFYPVRFETVVKESTANSRIYLSDIKGIEEKEGLIFLSATGEQPWIVPNQYNKKEVKEQKQSNILSQLVFLIPYAYIEIAKVTKSFSLFLKRKDNNEFEKIEINKKPLEFFARRMIETEYGKKFLSQPTADSGEHEITIHGENGDFFRQDFIPFKVNPIPGKYYVKSMQGENLFNKWFLPVLWGIGIYSKPEDRKDLLGSEVKYRIFEYGLPAGIFDHIDKHSPGSTFGSSKGFEPPLQHLHHNNNGDGTRIHKFIYS